MPLTSALAFALLLITSLPACAETLQGRLICIAGGDTLTVLVDGRDPIKVDLAGIDAPERGQSFGERSRPVRGLPRRR